MKKIKCQDFFKKCNRNTFLFILLIFLLSLFFYYFYHSRKNNINESFYVFFKPYETIQDMNTYNEVQYFLQNPDYQHYINFKYTNTPLYLYMIYSTYDRVFLSNLKFFFKQVVSNGNILDLRLKILTQKSKNGNSKFTFEYNPVEHILNKTNKEKYALSICDSSELFYCNSNNTFHPYPDKKNVRIVSGLYYNYVYCVAKNVEDIQKIEDLRGKRVGIFYPSLSRDYIIPYRVLYFYGEDFVNSINFVYGDVDELWSKMKKGEIDSFLFVMQFPNFMLDKIFNDLHTKEYILLPIEFEDTERYRLQNPYMEKATIDLNYVKQFLPRTINEVYYHRFNPIMNTYKSKMFIVCNNKIEDSATYNLVKLLSNQPIATNNLQKYFDNIKTLYLNTSLLPIPYHSGVEEYIKEKGYIGEIDDLECAYLVGNMKCDKKNLIKNRLFAWDFLSEKPKKAKWSLPDVITYPEGIPTSAYP
jgi:TRAP-type uncharacterized transport system substrate-binding protein